MKRRDESFQTKQNKNKYQFNFSIARKMNLIKIYR